QTQHQPAVHPFGLLGTITQKIVNRFLEIAKTLTSFVVRLDLEKLDDGCFVGKIKDRIEIR
ncbi:hypothetical protein VDG07_07680, partial [Xanthomonas campestris pv. raphani]|uniref:hypothetical protein n=1 Tax=Xanthomonas campestris TaxID=339 RepID=UPI002B228ED4